MAAKNLKTMIVLAIDTSCDETAVALLKREKSEFKILSNVVSSQIELHRKYGGVYPFLAKREHQKNLPVVFKKAVGSDLSKVDLLGVTAGPGLEPCLWQGINFAKELARKTGKSLVPVNHIEAHILSNYIERKDDAIKLPAICLVVSGGHTSLVLMKRMGKYKLIGETQDDAAGECFDKVARMLGLGYPGGPVIAANAAKIQNSCLAGRQAKSKIQIKLPRPMIHQKNYDFSFSGLKTAVLYNYKDQPSKIKKNREYVWAISFEIQQAIIDVLLHKTVKAAKDYRVKSIILGGGVAANDELRKQFENKLSKEGFNFFVPSKKFCTDNAAMIAVAAYFNRANKTRGLKNIIAKGNLSI